MIVVGESPRFLVARRLLSRIAEFDIPALIEGETGTGKDLAARGIHYQSARRDRPFIPVNCGSIPDALIENELFGHERGAYTDARQAMPGVVGLADGGTLFLDEIDALSPRAQVALLRFMQDQRYRPLGSAHDRGADVRIISASNQNVAALTQDRSFRSDLLFRIKVMYVELPPLRTRGADVRLLAEHFLDECASRYHQPRKRLHPTTAAWLESYEWPGNVRELENFIQRECLLTEGDAVLYPRPVDDASCSAARLAYKAAKAAALGEFDRRFLRELLARAGGNVTWAAREAGKDRRALGRLLKKYGIHARDYQLGESAS